MDKGVPLLWILATALVIEWPLVVLLTIRRMADFGEAKVRQPPSGVWLGGVGHVLDVNRKKRLRFVIFSDIV
jgi:hypothetical protein